jgi:hypothetical protein
MISAKGLYLLLSSITTFPNKAGTTSRPSTYYLCYFTVVVAGFASLLTIVCARPVTT